jgi:hypothetical protein
MWQSGESVQQMRQSGEIAQQVRQSGESVPRPCVRSRAGAATARDSAADRQPARLLHYALVDEALGLQQYLTSAWSLLSRVQLGRSIVCKASLLSSVSEHRPTPHATHALQQL